MYFLYKTVYLYSQIMSAKLVAIEVAEKSLVESTSYKNQFQDIIQAMMVQQDKQFDHVKEIFYKLLTAKRDD